MRVCMVSLPWTVRPTIQGISRSHAGGSLDRLRLQRNPDQDKVTAEDE